MTSPRPDPVGRAAVGGVVLFWVGTLVAGALVPGYHLTTDYVSSLAGRGSTVAPIGIAAIAVLGLAHLAAGAAVRGAVAVPLGLAGLAGLAIAAFRTGCPLGAAGCGTAPNTTADMLGTVHVLAVGGYEVFLVVATVLVAISRRRDEKLFALLSLAAAVLSVVLLEQTGGTFNGLWQRGWLVVNTGWLGALVLTRPSSNACRFVRIGSSRGATSRPPRARPARRAPAATGRPGGDDVGAVS